MKSSSSSSDEEAQSISDWWGSSSMRASKWGVFDCAYMRASMAEYVGEKQGTGYAG